MSPASIPDASVIASWRKSSYSGSENQNCVEISEEYPGAIPVRDSKDPHGPALMFRADGWSSFIEAIKRGEFSV
ncbi:hypothetical protein SRB5_40340 [Streptomyces sp. RB5]|uniref:DUF397 domain-containing protein n=1 Tax=Streptomyces smaragdinus TaxID=2585196 RepID=A0A7K0CK67_9ACTN|nr:DUF397 domain-containing protein [Streptomyces smaragdinus]MQY13878.1 hypothetical protein [Streptomyces smaragdinus]